MNLFLAIAAGLLWFAGGILCAQHSMIAYFGLIPTLAGGFLCGILAAKADHY